MKIGITCDHGGFKLKQKLVKYFYTKKIEVIDYGVDSFISADYPIMAFNLGKEVIAGTVDYGIAICSSGIGISIACNKIDGIRCAKVDNPMEARATRLDNDANILALNGTMPTYRALDIVDVFLKTDFSNEERHIRRINQITDYEKNRYIKPKKPRVKLEETQKETEVITDEC
ncbi:MAG: RpiB/LacA/LacB family sugar-phosphate isomerase [Bacilli bacterium]